MSDASGGDVSGAGDVGSTDATSSPQATPAEVTAAPAVTEISEVVAEPANEVVAETDSTSSPQADSGPAPVVETVVATPVPGTVVPAPTPVEPAIKSFLSRALEALQIGKRAKLDKILAEAKKKHSITNDGVEKLLRVSDATATRYLSQLVKEGKLRRVKDHSQTFYEPA